MISWSEKVKQGMGHPSVVFRFVYRYLHDLGGRKTQETHRCVFTSVDGKVACELDVCGSILVGRHHTRVKGKFFRLGMRPHPEKNWTNLGK